MIPKRLKCVPLTDYLSLHTISLYLSTALFYTCLRSTDWLARYHRHPRLPDRDPQPLPGRLEPFSFWVFRMRLQAPRGQPHPPCESCACAPSLSCLIFRPRRTAALRTKRTIPAPWPSLVVAVTGFRKKRDPHSPVWGMRTFVLYLEFSYCIKKRREKQKRLNEKRALCIQEVHQSYLFYSIHQFRDLDSF
jgi:hypothetical protein